MKVITSWTFSRARLLMVGALCALLVLAAPTAPASAARHARLLGDYAHTAWSAAQGAPAQIQAITQTPDGWLWLSTPTGLYRFDGVNFERRDRIGGHALLSTIVLPLHTAPDGGLWVGYRFGGASVFKDGKAAHYGADNGFPPGAAHSFTTAPDGVLWATTARGLAWLDRARDRWVRIGPDTGFDPRVPVWQVLFDRAGTQWVSTSNAVYYRRAGDARYRVASPAGIELASLAAAPDGTVWVSNGADANYRLSTAPPVAGATAPRPELPGSGMWFDRAGTMWLASETHVERVLADVFPDPRQRLTRDQGLSGLSPQTFFEDRDGNIWFGTATGLDRFRRYRAVPLPVDLPIVTPALAAGADGKVWLSNSSSSAWLMDAEGRQHAALDSGFWSSAAGAGGPALGTYQGIWQAGQTIPSPAAPLADSPTIYALARDRRGDWWASYLNYELFRFRDGKWEQPYPSLPKLRVMALLSDGRDRLWIGYQGNRIAVVDGGKATLMGAEHGLRIGNVLCIYEHHGNLWVAGESGAARYDGRRFVPLLLADGRELRGISGIVATDDGELWLHGHDGAFRIGAGQLGAFVRGGARVDYELLGKEEGLTGTVQPSGPFPSMVRAGDGKLWLSTTGGAMLITPGAIRRDPLPPPVELLAVSSNGKDYPADRPLRLPQGANNLHLAFTAPGLSVPERGAFRYRLDGVDQDWQNAGGRREAFYTNLQPGSYRFRVIAANRDGVWNNKGATLDIELPPTFVQSVWFKLLCGLALVALVALAWRWRLAQLAALIEARQLERLEERERIARALHDTFLQQAQGTLLMMQTAMEQIPPALPARAAMERGIGHIERALIEGRDEVMGLRSAARADETLAEALACFGDGLAEGLPARFRLQVRGAPYALTATTKDDLFAIGREAIGNAFRHADAGHIVVELNFGADALTLLVRDDGKGIPEEILQAGERRGHYGLVGMRERAARLGAALEVGGVDGGGALVRVTLPRGTDRRAS
ncbi:signal transduction histidine kinase/ligand-binding sensor domain-containing protein [Duganella sp. 1411]|uniref:sensor histidine kinase n=1 Tax=Duganella sp. 1411 TaxID=2806572 RepID=UPI001AE26373|nr:sensor histidine kinase [Duganella sp. 1411]MBP1205104.1 signal transduction histidine kinase/ligand-binding sensor domain-containing protein [Duganella sp. 1411]